MEELIWSAAEGVAPGAALRRWSAQLSWRWCSTALASGGTAMTAFTSDPHAFRSPACQIRRECIDNPVEAGRQARHARQRRERRTPVVVHRLFDDGGRVTRRRRVCPYRRHRSSGPLTALIIIPDHFWLRSDSHHYIESSQGENSPSGPPRRIHASGRNVGHTLRFVGYSLGTTVSPSVPMRWS